MGKVIIWTKQNKAVLHQIADEGRFVARERFMRAEHEDCSEIMLFLYRWLANHMPIQETRPRDAVFPVWGALSRDLSYPPDESSVLIEAAIPEDSLCCIDIIKWTTVSNYSYLAKDEEDRLRHNEEMRRCGLHDAKAVMTQFYPQQKRIIMNSWLRLFDGSSPTDPGKYALFWEIRREWVRDVIRCEETADRDD